MPLHFQKTAADDLASAEESQKTDELKLFGVEIRSSKNDSQYLVRAQNADDAVSCYLDRVINGHISVDPSDVADCGALRVITYPEKAGHPGMLSWEDISTDIVDIQDYAVWTDAIANGFDRERGAWNDDLEPGM
jgi:hypothetical protein